jgi:hypothetical protein
MAAATTTAAPLGLRGADRRLHTGKTRALYDAVRAVVPSWPVVRPTMPTSWCDFSRQVRSPRAWRCGSTRRSATAGLVEPWRRKWTGLAGTDRVVVGAMWRQPYWDELTAQGHTPDTYWAARIPEVSAALTAPRPSTSGALIIWRGQTHVRSVCGLDSAQIMLLAVYDRRTHVAGLVGAVQAEFNEFCT